MEPLTEATTNTPKKKMLTEAEYRAQGARVTDQELRKLSRFIADHKEEVIKRCPHYSMKTEPLHQRESHLNLIVSVVIACTVILLALLPDPTAQAVTEVLVLSPQPFCLLAEFFVSNLVVEVSVVFFVFLFWITQRDLEMRQTQINTTSGLQIFKAILDVVVPFMIHSIATVILGSIILWIKDQTCFDGTSGLLLNVQKFWFIKQLLLGCITLAIKPLWLVGLLELFYIVPVIIFLPFTILTVWSQVSCAIQIIFGLKNSKLSIHEAIRIGTVVTWLILFTLFWLLDIPCQQAVVVVVHLSKVITELISYRLFPLQQLDPSSISFYTESE